MLTVSDLLTVCDWPMRWLFVGVALKLIMNCELRITNFNSPLGTRHSQLARRTFEQCIVGVCGVNPHALEQRLTSPASQPLFAADVSHFGLQSGPDWVRFSMRIKPKVNDNGFKSH